MHWIKAEKDEVGARETFGRERIWGTKWEQETAQPDFGIKWSSTTIWGLTDKQEQILLGLQYAKEHCDRLLAKCGLIFTNLRIFSSALPPHFSHCPNFLLPFICKLINKKLSQIFILESSGKVNDYKKILHNNVFPLILYLRFCCFYGIWASGPWTASRFPQEYVFVTEIKWILKNAL